MTNRYHLNLATHPFRRYRITNILLSAALLLILAFLAWAGVNVWGYRDKLVNLAETDKEVLVNWKQSGELVEEYRKLLNEPETIIEVEEIRFLKQILDRQSFSWSGLLRVIEGVIPNEVYLLSLEPSVNEIGKVRIEMEVRSKDIEHIGAFIGLIEQTPDFQNVVVSMEERIVEEGIDEVSIVMDAEYLPQGNISSAEVQ